MKGKGVIQINKPSLSETFGISDTLQVVCNCWENRSLVSVYSFCTLVSHIFEYR